ncbi:MAG: hypothetical protein HKN10_15075 [Myxococcales bacterium]|nr:hypothetical protein [Myxococcales bacterium]
MLKQLIHTLLWLTPANDNVMANASGAPNCGIDLDLAGGERRDDLSYEFPAEASSEEDDA